MRSASRLVNHIGGSMRCVLEAPDVVTTHDVKPFKEIPGPKGLCNLPCIGPAFFFKPFTNHCLEKVHIFFNELIDRHGSLVRVHLGQWVVLVEDADDVTTVMRNEGKYPLRDGHEIHRQYCDDNGVREGLVQLQGKDWLNFRSPLNSRLTRASYVNHYLSVQNDIAGDLVTRLGEGPSPEETFEMIFRYTCESLGAVAFNKRLGYLRSSIETEKLETLQAIRDMFRLQNTCLYTPPFVLKHFMRDTKLAYKTALDRITSQALRYYKSSLEDILQKKREGRLNLDDKNILQSLTLSDKLSEEDLGALAVDMFSGGTDSTARAIQMFLYALAQNPEKQEKLHKEITTHLGTSEDITESTLKNMKYLSACLRESFRLFHPVLCGTQRTLRNDVTLQGYQVPAGTSVLIMSQKSAKNERYFPESQSFLPERWLRDATGARPSYIPPLALTPFGVGTRQCVGKRLAEQNIYTAITKIVQNFEVSLEPGHEDIDIIYQIFITTRDPIRFVFKKRK